MQADIILKTTIEIEQLTLSDWLTVASHCENSPKWGYHRWVEAQAPSSLEELSLKDWEAIAEAVGCDDRWAYYRYKEYSA